MSSNELTAFKAIKTDLEVSMDDVVSAFVSQYENNLFARKKELTATIKDTEESLSKFIKEVHKKINGDSYEAPLPFDLEMKIGEGSFSFATAVASFEITIAPKNNSRYGNSISIHKTKKIPAATVKAHDKIVDELMGLRADLAEVLVALKSVTRKERQVRGRIAMRKLEDSGYASLMQDQELAQLVQLDD